jgi:hypothetical protein
MMYEEEDSKGNEIPKQTINVSNCRDTQIVLGAGSLSSTDDENSLVAFFLDTFNFKRFLETIANSQKRFKITHNFINIILLLFFLTFVFWQDDVLRFEKISTTLTLVVLGICAFLEFLGANTSIFKGLFDSDLKTKKFIDNLSVLSTYEIETEVGYKNFSPSCLDYFIKGLIDINKYPQDTIYMVLDSQYLTKKNIDLLLSPEIIKNISPKIMFRFLWMTENRLTQSNILNIYKNFSDNRDVVKTLIATQEYSDFLIKSCPNDGELLEYYQRYQKEKMHLDWLLKVIQVDKLSQIRWLLLISILFFLSYCAGATSSIIKESISLFPAFEEPLIMFVGFFLVIIFLIFIINASILTHIEPKIFDYYYRRFIRNVTKKEKNKTDNSIE